MGFRCWRLAGEARRTRGEGCENHHQHQTAPHHVNLRANNTVIAARCSNQIASETVVITPPRWQARRSTGRTKRDRRDTLVVSRLLAE